MQPLALSAHQQPVDDLARQRRREEPRVGRVVQQPHQAHCGVQQIRVQWAHVDGRHGSRAPRRDVAHLDQDRAHHDGVEREDKPEIGALRRRLDDLGRVRQRDGGDEVVRVVIAVAVVAEQDLLAALRNQTKGRERHAMRQPRGRCGAVERQPGHQLDRPIVAHEPARAARRTPHGWRAPVPHSRSALPSVHHIHPSCLPRSRNIQRADLQDRTTILADHYTLVRSRAHILQPGAFSKPSVYAIEQRTGCEKGETACPIHTTNDGPTHRCRRVETVR